MKFFKLPTPTERENQARRDRIRLRRAALALTNAIIALSSLAALLTLIRLTGLLDLIGLAGQILVAAIMGAWAFDSVRNLKNAVAGVFVGDAVPHTDALWLPDKRYAWKGVAFESRMKIYSRYAMDILMYAVMFGYIPALLLAPAEIADTQTLKEMHEAMKGLYPLMVMFAIFGAIMGAVVGHLSRPDRENQL